MSTVYLGETFRKHRGQATRFERYFEEEPSGDDMPVFDRASYGGRGEYERPDRWEDRVTMRRLPAFRR